MLKLSIWNWLFYKYVNILNGTSIVQVSNIISQDNFPKKYKCEKTWKALQTELLSCLVIGWKMNKFLGSYFLDLDFIFDFCFIFLALGGKINKDLSMIGKINLALLKCGWIWNRIFVKLKQVSNLNTQSATVPDTLNQKLTNFHRNCKNNRHRYLD